MVYGFFFCGTAWNPLPCSPCRLLSPLSDRSVCMLRFCDLLAESHLLHTSESGTERVLCSPTPYARAMTAVRNEITTPPFFHLQSVGVSRAHLTRWLSEWGGRYPHSKRSSDIFLKKKRETKNSFRIMTSDHREETPKIERVISKWRIYEMIDFCVAWSAKQWWWYEAEKQS